ncbi:MAG TPA: CPBP family intramembrane glutamic endopeptidase [Gaiellaceae bacterium]|nr:CPBP family intramembrane glutamic endopeptidase [Gaiellaceae bacterium]
MDPSAPQETPVDRDPADSVEIPQYSLLKILAVWAAAALPMAALAWLVAPAIKDSFGGEENVPLVKALLICLTAGLIWQFVLVVILVRREQGTLGWPVVREALWLRAPRNPKTGQRGGRLWLILIPLILLFAVESMIPAAGVPSDRDLVDFIDSDVGKHFLSGAWGWFALIVVLQIFNTVLGEELLFRGLLLPRMNRAFGRGDWAANGVLFAAYHLHVPWAIPATLLDTFIIAYPSKRYRSALIGIAVHSVQSVFFIILIFTLVA